MRQAARQARGACRTRAKRTPQPIVQEPHGQGVAFRIYALHEPATPLLVRRLAQDLRDRLLCQPNVQVDIRYDICGDVTLCDTRDEALMFLWGMDQASRLESASVTPQYAHVEAVALYESWQESQQALAALRAEASVAIRALRGLVGVQSGGLSELVGEVLAYAAAWRHSAEDLDRVLLQRDELLVHTAHLREQLAEASNKP